ncbi:hypothetical protein [Niabella sp.]|uniref:hypothetical protein n=1 Tax=Niabella sp. TaxID=1962976 RepID=UPI00260EB2D2|nr:hypothetical protein [Niabella sp.]
MKITTRILCFILIVLMAGLLSSNMILKQQYDAVDKTDLYWTYTKVLEQPFRHLHITGGNGTHIFYEPADKPSVRLLQEWINQYDGKINTSIKNDTLYLNFDHVPANPYEKFWLQNAAPVRIFSPELLSVTGHNTNFEMQKLKQKYITATITGKSRFEIETLQEMDTVNVYGSDSSSVTVELSPDYKKAAPPAETQQPIRVKAKNGNEFFFTPAAAQNSFNESFSIRSVNAVMQGHSILDIGHAQVGNLKLQLADSAAIVVSGDALKKANK